jgi:hypothetical protein
MCQVKSQKTPNVASWQQFSTWDPVGYVGVGMGENINNAEQKLVLGRMVQSIS